MHGRLLVNDSKNISDLNHVQRLIPAYAGMLVVEPNV